MLKLWWFSFLLPTVYSHLDDFPLSFPICRRYSDGACGVLTSLTFFVFGVGSWASGRIPNTADWNAQKWCLCDHVRISGGYGALKNRISIFRFFASTLTIDIYIPPSKVFSRKGPLIALPWASELPPKKICAPNSKYTKSYSCLKFVKFRSKIWQTPGGEWASPLSRPFCGFQLQFT